MIPRIEQSPRDLLSRWAPYGLLALLPLALLAVNPNWIYNFPGWADQWIYFGNHEGLRRKLKLFSDSYRVTRFSWDLPAVICNFFLPSIPARLLLHLGCFYAALFSFFTIVRKCLGSRMAWLGALLMGGYPLFVTSQGWDYVDGVCQVYFLLTLLCVLRATEGTYPRTLLTLAGCFFAAGVYAYPLFLLYGPIVGAFFLRVNGSDKRITLGSALRLFTGGFVILTLVFCVFFFSLTKRFFFFAPAITFTSGFLKLHDVNPVEPGWLGNASWVVVPAAVFLASLVAAVLHLCRRTALDQAGRNTVFFLLANCGLFLALVGCEIFLRHPCFRQVCFLGFLTPPTFLALAALLRPIAERTSGQVVAGVLGGVALLLLLPLWPPLRPALAPLVTPVVIWSLAALLMGLLLVSCFVRSRWLAPCCVLAVAASGSLVAFGVPWGFDQKLGFAPRDIHLAFVQSHKICQEVWPRQPYRFWFPANDPLTQAEVYSSLAQSTDIGTSVFLGKQFPDRADFISPSKPFILQPGTHLIVLSNEEDVAARANLSLQEVGLTATFVTERSVRQGTVAFTMTFLKVVQSETLPKPLPSE
jgi:hypothetical protein